MQRNTLNRYTCSVAAGPGRSSGRSVVLGLGLVLEMEEAALELLAGLLLVLPQRFDLGWRQVIPRRGGAAPGFL